MQFDYNRWNTTVQNFLRHSLATLSTSEDIHLQHFNIKTISNIKVLVFCMQKSTNTFITSQQCLFSNQKSLKMFACRVIYTTEFCWQTIIWPLFAYPYEAKSQRNNLGTFFVQHFWRKTANSTSTYIFYHISACYFAWSNGETFDKSLQNIRRKVLKCRRSRLRVMGSLRASHL